MDIIDPTLASSASSIARDKADAPDFQPLFWQIIGLVTIAFIIWIVYSGYDSRLDTTPEEIIDINTGLQGPSASDGQRQLPISEVR